ncbi:hypothetical protein AAC691_13725 [Nguyenibacter vanlangensis]|uniref:Uncharacterized protein n=1 Tax=Nguyenibacter vanlangensis TaxID=1216886 RepID=A0ABZ3D0T3_9PROT
MLEFTQSKMIRLKKFCVIWHLTVHFILFSFVEGVLWWRMTKAPHISDAFQHFSKITTWTGMSAIAFIYLSSLIIFAFIPPESCIAPYQSLFLFIGNYAV